MCQNHFTFPFWHKKKYITYLLIYFRIENQPNDKPLWYKMEEEEYKLAWNGHAEQVTETLNELMISNNFTDVTLVCNDKILLQAHRIILSSCSTFFKEIFTTVQGDYKPIIYLKGVKHEEMKSILQFIYTGEATFSQNRTNEFIRVATDLEIKALIRSDFHEASHDYINEDGHLAISTSSKHEDGIKERDTPLVQTEVQYKEEISIKANRNVTYSSGPYFCLSCHEPFLLKKDLKMHCYKQHNGIDGICLQCGYQSKCKEDLRDHKKRVHNYKECSKCEFIGRFKSKVTEHEMNNHEISQESIPQTLIKRKFERIPDDNASRFHEIQGKFKHKINENGIATFFCSECEYQNPKLSNLSRHIRVIHLGQTFPCDQCGYQATRMFALKKHINAKHNKAFEHACNQCDKKFNYYLTLSNHINFEHLGISHQCKLCKSKFNAPGNLRLHMRKYHS